MTDTCQWIVRADDIPEAALKRYDATCTKRVRLLARHVQPTNCTYCGKPVQLVTNNNTEEQP